MQLEAGEVLSSDPFSFTFSGQAWRTQSWLLELGYGWSEQRVGLGFVPLWVFLAGILIVVVVGLNLNASGPNLSRLALGSVMFGWIVSGYLAPRPVLISYVWLALLILATRHPRYRWVIPLLLWLWAATHGSFVVGIGFLVLEAIRTGRGDLGRQAALGLGVTSLTAHGWHVWEILWRFFANREALSYIVEWAPPKVFGFSGLPFFAGLIGIVFQATRGRVLARDLWIVAPFLLYGLTSYRALFPAMVVLLPWMVPELAFMRRSPDPTNPMIVFGTGLVILLLPLVMLGSWGSINEDVFPVAASEFLDDELPTFHDDGAGGYLIYARGPSMKIYVDDRAELYGGEFVARLGRVLAGSPIWVEDSDKWGIRQALLGTDDDLVDSLSLAGWSEVFRDENFVLLRNN